MTSPTAAGQTELEEQRQDAINQIFALFRINYHNQYHAAFNDTQVLSQAKRLWFDSLRCFPPELLLKAARQVTEESEYLPSLQRMISACESQLPDIGLPTTRDAYLEACNAPGPRNAYEWSHPAVYLAGAKVGWQRLATGSERDTFAEFCKRYREQVRRVARGDKLTIDRPEQLSHQPGEKLSREEQLKNLAKLKQLLND